MKRIINTGFVAIALGLCSSCEQYDFALTNVNTPVERGRAAIQRYGCASCHTIPGIRGANGLVGPSLDRMASRTYIAGVLINSPNHLVQWIRNPPGVDDKTAMPNLHLSEQDAHEITSYLLTLR